MVKTILFDLDGTLTDSGEGIINSAILGLRHFGLPVPDRDTLRVFVGPPLHETFVHFGVPADRVEEAVKVFRSRYMTVGKFENFPYPGIADLLSSLKKKGHTLLVATSKPEILANEVLEHFSLSGYFDAVCGATLDQSRVSKEDVLTYLLGQYGDLQNMIMVGDTHFDILGAAAHNIPAVGVSWGYGDTEKMKKSGAVAIADTPDELLKILDEL